MDTYNLIETDSALASILSHFDSNYINHLIDDSLLNRFRPFDEPMPNVIEVINSQFASIEANAPSYRDKVREVRDQTYIEVICKICDFYNLKFAVPFEEISPMELFGIARELYDIFISRFTVHMIDFFTSYIINNADAISSYLKTLENYSDMEDKAGRFAEESIRLIHANANKVITNMAVYDISLDQLLSYFTNPDIAMRLSNLLQDCGDIYKNHYASFIVNNVYSSETITSIKLELQARTQIAKEINVK